jgi:hypothetical protein
MIKFHVPYSSGDKVLVIIIVKTTPKKTVIIVTSREINPEYVGLISDKYHPMVIYLS